MRHLAPLAAVCAIAFALLAPRAPAAPTTDSWQGDAPAPASAPAPAKLAKQAAKASKPATPSKPVVLVKAAAGTSVTIKDFSFRPATIDIKAGDTVTWRNDDSTDHTATGKTFDTGVLSQGRSGSFTFNHAGTFAYVCSIHPNMKGTVHVTAAASQAPAPEDNGTAQAPSSTPSPSAAQSGGGPRLPRTGGGELPIAGLGALLLALGAVLTRRSRTT
jgi:plastocyanin